MSSHLATNLVSKFHRVSCINKNMQPVRSFLLSNMPWASFGSNACSKAQQNTVCKHSQSFLRVDSSISDIFSDIFGFPPELMVTYHLTFPSFQLHQPVRTDGVCGFFQGHPCICDVGTVNIDLTRAAERI